MIPELEALTQRLEEVEKQVAHLGALAVERSDTDRAEAARTVNAQTFIVTDTRGVRRAELSMSIPAGGKEENPWLGLFDADGNVRACLGVDERGLPWLEFYDASQNSVLNVVVDEHGPEIGLFHGNKEAGVRVSLAEGWPRVVLIDGDGKQAIHLVVSESGTSILLDGRNGQMGVGVSVIRNGSEVALFDGDGKRRASLNVPPSGEPSLYMGGTEGPSLKAAIEGGEAQLLFGKDNKVIWSAP